MATLKSVGMRWFRENVHEGHSHTQTDVKVSRLYAPGEAWTKSASWWIDVPSYVINESFPDHVHFLCEKQKEAEDFYHLKIPKALLMAAAGSGTVSVTKSGILRFYLSATAGNRFVDLRGDGRLDLRPFVQ